MLEEIKTAIQYLNNIKTSGPGGISQHLMKLEPPLDCIFIDFQIGVIHRAVHFMI